MDSSNKNEAKKHTEPRSNSESDEESNSNYIQEEAKTDDGRKTSAVLPSASSNIINDKAKKHIKPQNCPESDAENNSNYVQGHPTKGTTEEVGILISKNNYSKDFSQDDNTYKNKPNSSQNRPLSCTMVVNPDFQQCSDEELILTLEKDFPVPSTSKEGYSDDNSSSKDEISSNISDNSTAVISNSTETGEVSSSSSPDFSLYISYSDNMQLRNLYQNDSLDEKPTSSSTFTDDVNFETVTSSDIDDDNANKEYTLKFNKGLKKTSSSASHATFSYYTIPGYMNYDKPSTGPYSVDLSRSTEQSIILDTPSSSSNNNNNASSSTDASVELPKSAISLIGFSSSSDDVVAPTSEIAPLEKVVDTDTNNSTNKTYKYMQMLDDTGINYKRPSTSSNIRPSNSIGFFEKLETITEIYTPSMFSDISLSRNRERFPINVEIVKTTKPFSNCDFGFVPNNNDNDNQENVEPSTSSDITPSTTSNKIKENEDHSYACSSSITDLAPIPSSDSGNILRYSLERAPLTSINKNGSSSSSSRPHIGGQEENVLSTPSSSKVNNNQASTDGDQSTINRVLTKRGSTVPANINNLDTELGIAENISNPPPKKLKTKRLSTSSTDPPSHFQTYFDELQRPKSPVENTEDEDKIEDN